MIDLLRGRTYGRMAASRSYPLTAEIITLIAFGLLVAGGLAAPHVPAKMTGVLRNTNLASLVVWSLWWPLVILSAALMGRVWCQVCPMELVNSLFSQVGLKRRMPRVLVSGWGVAVFYSASLLGFIRTFWAHRYPERMSIFFLFLLGSALIAGLVFEKRAFCNFLCPVGRLLGLYACCAPLEWRVRDAKTCEACRSKDCVAAPYAYRLSGRSCTSNLYPASIKDNRECLICTQCRKVCPKDNLRLSLRKPLGDFFGTLRLSSVEFFLLLLISGLVIWELAEEWSPARKVLEFLPNKASSWLGVSGEAANFVQTLFLIVLFPALLFLVPALAGKLADKKTIVESGKAFGLLFLPVVALGHAAKAVIRITSRLPYYPLAFKDPVGHSTANLISSGELKVDSPIAAVLSAWAGWLAVLLLALAMLSVWLIGLRSPTVRALGRPRRAWHLAIATLYSAVLVLIALFARLG